MRLIAPAMTSRSRTGNKGSRDGAEMSARRAAKQEEVYMKKSVFLGTLATAALAAGFASAGTLDDVKARGSLNCGVSSGVNGFSAPDANGVWQGFDVAVCRAVAAAVLGDPMAVNFVPTMKKMISRNSTSIIDVRFSVGCSSR